ncbi:hypothetical protein EGW08_005602 [Elysia chlorotica]|uniref:Methyltransferase type 11 domain-containing protein n=1 Tax=Elysia chlorotica TaxID=188477 RepID=A0A433TYK0_ELYCH|nr:hypothetical protein EGW08_005602 [Elysia chlorotica]
MFKISDISIQRSHEVTVDVVCEFLPESKKKLVVLDVGAGTGRVAEEMLNRGFQLIDALESSEQRLSVAKKRSLYDNYYNCNIAAGRLPIDDGVYDVVVSAEGIGERRIPCAALRELARVTKPGGVVVISLKEEHLHTISEYMDRLEPAMMSLQTDGHWELLTREVVPYYSDGKTGLVFAFKRCHLHGAG